MQDINIGPLDLRNPEDPEEFIDESFEMDDDYVPTTEIDLITLPDMKGNRTRVLTNGNIMLFVAPHGTGKSAFVEALVSKGLNKTSDAFGFEVNLSDKEEILVIDTEKTKNDMKRSWARIIKKARLWSNRPAFFSGNKIRRLKLVSYKFLSSGDQYLKHLRAHAAQGRYRLIFIDVVTDFLTSINKEEEAKAFAVEVMKIAEQYDCGIVLTIHPNPKDKDYKARGHVGTILSQKAESVFACFKADDDTRVITTDYSEGKNRNGYDKFSTAFMFDDTEGMHVSVYLSEEIKAKISKEYLEFDAIVEEIFTNKDGVFESDGCRTQEEMLATFQLKLNRMDLDWEYIENYIKERQSLYKNEIDGKYYMKSFGDEKAPF